MILKLKYKTIKFRELLYSIKEKGRNNIMKKNIFKLPPLLRNIFTLIIISVFLFIINIASAELLINTYCQLCINIMQLEASNLQELISIKNQYQDDPDTLIRQIAIKKAEYKQNRDALFSSFGITENEYALYKGEHEREVTVYLEDNPDIKQQIDDLSSQVHTFLNEYESN